MALFETSRLSSGLYPQPAGHGQLLIQRTLFTADWDKEGAGTYEAKDYYNDDATDEWDYSFSGLSGKVSGTWSISDKRLSIKGSSQIAGEYIIEGLVVNGCRLVRASNPDEYPYLLGGWHQR